jgi:anthranilate phosphoribosyltransferase
MQDFPRIIRKLVSKQELSDDEIVYALNWMLEGKASQPSTESFLVALSMKGETARELSVMMRIIKEHAIRITPRTNGVLVDTCGTGGGRINTFNVSTASAIIASSAGAKVAKHGNRSASGICGSADFMEQVGLDLGCPIFKIVSAVEQVGFGFLYAPKFHPAIRNVAAARKAIGIRTVFNIIGPVSNPCTNLGGQLIGAPEPKMIESLALAMQHSDIENIILVNSRDGLDELSNTCENDVTWIRQKRVKHIRLNPRDLGIDLARLETLTVRSREESIRETLRVIYGVANKQKQDIAVINASAALVVAKVAANFREGVDLARDAISDGRAGKKLSEYIRRCGQKRLLLEVEKRYLR